MDTNSLHSHLTNTGPRHLNTYIHTILKLLKNYDHPLTFAEIKQHTNIDLVTNKPLVAALENNPKIRVQNNTLLFQPLYRIRNREDLFDVLKIDEGVELSNLLDSPVDVMPFVKELEDQNSIYILRDMDGSQIIFLNSMNLKKVDSRIVDLWKGIDVPNYQDIVKELNTAGIRIGGKEEVVKKRHVVVQKSKIKKYKRRIKITNTHVPGLDLNEI